jgi:hypothetical protein
VASISDSGLDHALKQVDVDLTLVAGGGTLRLLVKAGPSSGQDWAVWVDPKIEH